VADPWAAIGTVAPSDKADPWASVGTPASPAAAPKAPPPAPKENSGGVWDFVGKVADRFAEIPKAAVEGQRQANEAIKEDFTGPKSQTDWKKIGRVAKTTLDVAGYPFAAVGGAVHNVVGQPIEKAIGEGSVAGRLVGNTADAAAGVFGPEMAAKAAPKAAEEALRAAKGATGAAEKIFSPGTVDDHARAAVELHKSILGKRGLEADKAAYTLGQHQRVVGNASPQEQLALIHYVENRSAGKATISDKLRPAADAIREVAQAYRKQIETVFSSSTGGPNFVQDYYARMWEQKPEDVERAIYGGKQGSGRNLRTRSLPTYEDGLNAGLTPRYKNPLDAMTAYADNMARYLGAHEILDGMKSAKEIGAKMFVPGTQPEGWVPLKGMKTSEPAVRVMEKGKVVGSQPGKQLFAPEGAARVYNNHLSKGLDQGDVGPFYRGARAASNGLVQLKLGLSAFHATVMGEEGMVSEIARAIKKGSRGDVVGAAKSLAATPFAPVRTAMRGAKMKDQILGRAPISGLDAKVNVLYERSGQRLNMDKIYATRRGTSLLSSTLRGTLKRDLGDALKGVKEKPIRGSIDLAGNIIQSAAAPIFEHYVPNMKRGAWAKGMEDFLQANPNATPQEQLRYGQRLADNIDNRFGELVVNNNFWHKSGFQIAQLLMLSPSWNLGTVREIGGGVVQIPESLKGLVEGKGVTDKTAYVAALVGLTAIQNGIATYLHTGQMPEGMDWFAYRTGGTDSKGQPERAVIPSYMKDVLAFTIGDPRQEIANKANPALSTAAQLYNNKDFRNDPIRNEQGSATEQAAEVGKYAADEALPMSLGPSSKPRPGSKLNPFERFTGVRPAGAYLTRPEALAASKKKRDSAAWKAKLKHDRQADNTQ
jgi:hypothetical protein